MVKLLVVGAGGFLGAILRYVMSELLQSVCGGSLYPYGTLGVNVLGCIFIGLLAGLSEGKMIFTPEVRLFLLVGLLGGFTTFSTFGYETFSLMRDSQNFAAAMNVLLNVLVGVSAVFAGFAISNLIAR